MGGKALKMNKEFVETCEWCNNNGVEHMSFTDISIEAIKTAKKFGIKIMTYTYNEPATIYKYLDLGVDCVFTDYIFI